MILVTHDQSLLSQLQRVRILKRNQRSQHRDVNHNLGKLSDFQRTKSGIVKSGLLGESNNILAQRVVVARGPNTTAQAFGLSEKSDKTGVVFLKSSGERFGTGRLRLRK